MATADQASRTAPPPPIPALLSEELEIYEEVLSWARGGALPTSGGGGGFDAAAAQAAMEKGRELVRSKMRAANPEEVSKTGGGYKGKGKAKVPSTTAVEQAAGGSAGGSASSGGDTEVSGAEGAGAGSNVVPGTTAPAAASPETTVAAAVTMPPTAAEVLADRASAEAELRAHATGLLAAGLLSRELSDLIVNKGFAAHLVQRLREGPVADYLRAEAAKEHHRKASSGDGALGGGGSAAGNSGDPAVVVAGAAGSAAAAGGDGAAAAASAAVGAAVASAAQQPAPTYGRWANVAAVEAEHVAACISGIGGYQEVILFSFFCIVFSFFVISLRCLLRSYETGGGALQSARSCPSRRMVALLRVDYARIRPFQVLFSSRCVRIMPPSSACHVPVDGRATVVPLVYYGSAVDRCVAAGEPRAK